MLAGSVVYYVKLRYETREKVIKNTTYKSIRDAISKQQACSCISSRRLRRRLDSPIWFPSACSPSRALATVRAIVFLENHTNQPSTTPRPPRDRIRLEHGKSGQPPDQKKSTTSPLSFLLTLTSFQSSLSSSSLSSATLSPLSR